MIGDVEVSGVEGRVNIIGGRRVGGKGCLGAHIARLGAGDNFLCQHSHARDEQQQGGGEQNSTQ